MPNIVKKIVSTLALVLIFGTPSTLLAMQPVNINTATMAELQTVGGIGPKVAERIVAYRNQHGQFEKIESLCEVQGIGETSLHKMKNELCME